MADILIVGAGLTGLSTAYHLEQNNHFDYQLFEQEAEPGGLARSVKHKGFTFDFTGHFIHINNPYFNHFINTTLGTHNLKKQQRKSAIYSHNILVNYPFQTNLKGLPPSVIIECITEFINRKNSAPDSFYDWVLTHFGVGLANHFFSPYNSKLLAYDIKKIDHTWTDRFIPQTTLHDLLLGALCKKTNSKGYNSTFYYPHSDSIQQLPNTIAAMLKKKINYLHKATRIDVKRKEIFFENGTSHKFCKLVSTMPLPELLQMLQEPNNSALTNAARRLLCTTVINFNIGIDHSFQQNNFSKKHWIYFPEKSYPFYRIGFWHTISPQLAPKGCSAIYGETSYLRGTKTKNEVETLLKESKQQTYKLLKLDKKQILAEKTLYLPYAYVLYNQWRKQHLAQIHKRLAEYGIYSIGRFGSWNYSSMQEAIIEGKTMAEQIAAQKVHVASLGKKLKQVQNLPCKF